MRYFSLVSVSPVVDDLQLSDSVKKQHRQEAGLCNAETLPAARCILAT